MFFALDVYERSFEGQRGGHIRGIYFVNGVSLAFKYVALEQKGSHIRDV